MQSEKAENHLLNSTAPALQVTAYTALAAMKTTGSVALFGLVLLSCLSGKLLLLQSSISSPLEPVPLYMHPKGEISLLEMWSFSNMQALL